MARDDQEIQKKLVELEASIKQEEQSLETNRALDSDNTSPKKVVSDETLANVDQFLGADLNFLVGSGLTLVGLLMIFSHIRMGTSFMTWFGYGSRGMGFIVLPLLIGIGMLFYNFKSRIAWLLTIAGCALIIFVLLSQLVMTFQSISLLGFLLMFIPLVAGITFIVKGVKMRQQVKGEIADKASS